MPFRNCFKACLYPRVNWKISIGSPIVYFHPPSRPSRCTLSIISHRSKSPADRPLILPSQITILPFQSPKYIPTPNHRCSSTMTENKTHLSGLANQLQTRVDGLGVLCGFRLLDGSHCCRCVMSSNECKGLSSTEQQGAEDGHNKSNVALWPKKGENFVGN